MAEVIAQILQHFQLNISQVMMKINDKAMSVNHLTMKTSQLASKNSSQKNSLTISVFETYEC